MSKSKKEVGENVVQLRKDEHVEEQFSRHAKWDLLKPTEEVDCSWHEESAIERLYNQLDLMCHHLREHQPDGCNLQCYAEDDFPRDIEMGAKYEAIKGYPREIVDAWLLQDSVEGRFCREHGEERLTKLFRKYDSIQKKANKQWLRVLVKEAYEAGVFDEEGEST